MKNTIHNKKKSSKKTSKKYNARTNKRGGGVSAKAVHRLLQNYINETKDKPSDKQTKNMHCTTFLGAWETCAERNQELFSYGCEKGQTVAVDMNAVPLSLQDIEFLLNSFWRDLKISDIKDHLTHKLIGEIEDVKYTKEASNGQQIIDKITVKYMGIKIYDKNCDMKVNYLFTGDFSPQHVSLHTSIGSQNLL